MYDPVKYSNFRQKIPDSIKEETTHPDHEDYGMFVLVLMSHGLDGDVILGSDMKAVKLSDVYDLLSPLNFPKMAGKPKLIIIQACSGGKYQRI